MTKKIIYIHTTPNALLNNVKNALAVTVYKILIKPMK